MNKIIFYVIITLKDQILIITLIDQMQQMIYFILKMINNTSDSVDQVNKLSKGKSIVNMYKIK